MADQEEERKSSGCGLLVLYYSVFRRPSSSAPRRSSSTSSIPNTNPHVELSPSNSKRRRAGSDEATLLRHTKPPDLPPFIPKSSLNQMLTPPSTAYQKPYVKPVPVSVPVPVPMSGPGALKRMQSNGLTAELDSMIHDHQRTKGSSTLVRASSGNVMLYGNLGNIRAPGAVTTNANANASHLPKPSVAKVSPSSMAIEPAAAAAPVMSMCRALSRRLDPEELKEMGNEEYNNGRYPEAIALYDRAISVNPEVASYHSNKAAALMRLGLLLEAVAECAEAVRLDPCYSRAHHRLATLHLRLGDAEKAIRYYKLAKGEAKANDIPQAQALQNHLNKCNEARRQRDWNTVLKEAEAAIASGADAAPQVFAYQAEALLMIHKQEEADSTLIDAPKYENDASTNFFGASVNAYILAVQAQVNIAAGRFEDAVAVAQKAARIDQSSRDANAAVRKALNVASARSKGNDLFKASKFEEACAAYGEGLAHDSHNAILLCNRAACRSKLGQWEKAIEDCNAALNMRPSYSKARLRKADCNSKLERWEASIEDYEKLLLDVPGDEEISKALSEAQAKFKIQQAKLKG